MTRKKCLLAAALVLLLLAGAFWGYVGDYYPADETALLALASDAVTVEKAGYGWFFDGPSEESALIFYPGAKVEETAYAPLLHRLAEDGMDVCLVKMPFHLAIFHPNAADRVMEQYEYAHWYIGGHSLGGAMAANYAADHSLDGVILLASYPTKAVDEPMLILYGANDGVLNQKRVEAADSFGTVKEIVIEGGNHAYFGDYGPQRGDGAAAITPEEQQQTAADAIEAWIS